MTAPVTRPVIAVLGLGEAGSLIAADLAAAGATVRGHDPKMPAPAGVRSADSDAAAVSGASLVLSVNSAADALRDALPALATGTIWADLNTATPGLNSRRHAVRRRDEMAAAAELLDDLGVPPRIATAARDVLEGLIQPQQTP